MRVGIPRSPAVVHREAGLSPWGLGFQAWVSNLVIRSTFLSFVDLFVGRALVDAVKPMQVRAEVPATPNTMTREAWVDFCEGWLKLQVWCLRSNSYLLLGGCFFCLVSFTFQGLKLNTKQVLHMIHMFCFLFKQVKSVR